MCWLLLCLYVFHSLHSFLLFRALRCPTVPFDLKSLSSADDEDEEAEEEEEEEEDDESDDDDDDNDDDDDDENNDDDDDDDDATRHDSMMPLGASSFARRAV